MARFAVLNGTAITAFIIADNKEIAESITKKVCVEYLPTDPIDIGTTYNFETNSFNVNLVNE